MITSSDYYNTPNSASNVFSAVLSGLEADTSAGIVMCGDFTTNGSTEVFELLSRMISEERADARVEFYFFQDGSTPAYLSPNIFAEGRVRSQSIVSRERCVNFNGGRPRRLPNTIGMVSGDLEFSVKLQHATWRPASVSTFGGYWNPAVSQRSWKVTLNTDGTISLWYSRDGVEQLEAKSTAAVAVPATPTIQRRAIKVTRNATTGVVQFFVGTEAYNSGSPTLSITYTQLGADVSSTAGNLFTTVTPTVSTNTASTSYTVAGWETTGERFTGRIFGIAIRDGINGPILNPQGIENWSPDVGTSDQSVIEGPPTLWFHNASPNNGSFTNHWLVDAKRKLMVRRHDTGIVFLNANSNEGTTVGRLWDSNLDAFKTFLASWAPGLTLVVLNGVPKGGTTTEREQRVQAKRASQTVAWAARNNVTAIDTYRAFLKDRRPLSDLLLANGTDVSVAGGQLMADSVWKALFTRTGS